MSDSGRSFSLKYDLIRPPSLINTYIFSGSFSCSVCFRLFRLVLSVTRDERRLNIGEYIDSFNSSTTVEMADREGKSSL